MKLAAVLLVLVLFAPLLGACGAGPTPAWAPRARPTEAAEAPAATPTPPGTWEIVIWGTVYDASSGVEKPVAGARVSYDHFSYQGGGKGSAVTDESGGYEFTLLVHDTDRFEVSVQAEGFAPFSRRFTGIELYTGGRERRMDLGLSPLSEATQAP